MNDALPVWRSLLYVPAHVDRFVAKAHERGADCIQIDLEDSVPAAAKDAARSLVQHNASRVRRGGADVLVRINRPLSLAVRDIEASVSPDVDGFVLPKVGSADHVRLLEDHIAETELRLGLVVGHSRLVVLIETAAAWLAMADIAKASPRIVGLNLGSEDFALDCAMESTPDALQVAKQHVVFAARAARILPLGVVGSMADFGDEAAFREMVRRSRCFGFAGASCIHPAQVSILNELFAPSPAEVDAARRIVDALAAAEKEGRGAVALDGRMIDAPIAESARRTVERQAVIEARSRRPAPAA